MKQIRNSSGYHWALFLIMLAAAALPLAAQTGLGTIRGVVRDATGAVLSKAASVTLTNTVTGVALRTRLPRSARSTSALCGRVLTRSKLTATGFKKWSGNLQLDVGQTAVVDATMEVGSVELPSRSRAPRRSSRPKARR